MRLAELDAFNQMLKHHFYAARPATNKLPELLSSHEFEWNLAGHLVEVQYQTRWDRLDCVEEIVYPSIRVLHNGDDLTEVIKDSVFHTIVNEVERQFNDPEGERS